VLAGERLGIETALCCGRFHARGGERPCRWFCDVTDQRSGANDGVSAGAGACACKRISSVTGKRHHFALDLADDCGGMGEGQRISRNKMYDAARGPGCGTCSHAPVDRLGQGFGAIHQRHGISRDALDGMVQKRVMRASEDEGVDVGASVEIMTEQQFAFPANRLTLPPRCGPAWGRRAPTR